MNALLRFKKIAAKQNILFDEFFLEYNDIEFIAFNFNAQGSALCRCDGVLQAIDKNTVAKILFGVTTARLDIFVRGIYNPDCHSEDLKKTAGELVFNQSELNELSKYSLGNLAKEIHKKLEEHHEVMFSYYEEEFEGGQTGEEPAPPQSKLLRGNTKSLLFHNPGCINYDGKQCTAKFVSRKEAVSSGYKPCKICN